MKENHETHLRIIYEHAYQLLGLLSVDGILLEANPAALRQVGASSESIIGLPFWQTPWWDHSAHECQRIKDAIERAARGEFVRFETTHPNGRGGFDHIDFSLTPIHDAAGDVVYLLPEGRRINTLKAALAKAAEGERRFRELAELLPETVYEMDITGRFTYVNQKAFAQFGYDQEDFDAGASALDMIIPDDHQRAIENIARIMDGQTVYHNEYTCLRKDGSTFPGMFYSAVKRQGGEAVGVQGIIIDNSHQRSMAAALREWKTRYRIATEAGHTGVWDHDLETGEMVIDANLKNMFGFGSGEVTRWDAWQSFFHPDDVAHFIERSRAYVKGLIPSYEVRGRARDRQGRERWILIRATAERDADGRVRRMIGSATDITSHYLAEQALKQARDDLEVRVASRTRELNKANTTLRAVVREKITTAKALKEREAELELKTAKLEDMNTALRYLLKKIDREKKDVEEKMMADLRDLVHPYLKKLARKSHDREARTLVAILENHLKAIVAPFSRYLTSPAINLSPAELNIARMVRDGKRTKEIAAILNLSYKTVETHRVNIRKKLGLTGKGKNLRTCLMAMDNPKRSLQKLNAFGHGRQPLNGEADS